MSPERTLPPSMISTRRCSTWPQVDDATLWIATLVLELLFLGSVLVANASSASICASVHKNTTVPRQFKASDVAAGQLPQLGRQPPARPLAPGDDQHGVVACDTTDDFGELLPVESAAERL